MQHNSFVSDYNVLSCEWPSFNNYLVIIEWREQSIFAFVKEKLSLTFTIHSWDKKIETLHVD